MAGLVTIVCDRGSSPLSRGIRLADCLPVPLCRIIPALAGNTKLNEGIPFFTADHPRSRGEYVIDIITKVYVMGSSPLSRGIPATENDLLAASGIIPALAGNTGPSRAPLWTRRDHPRSRGEYWVLPVRASCCIGSSPLSRGIPAVGDRRDGRSRIIPALAGNTTSALSA